MFSVGDKVVYKTNAVCNVEAIDTPVFAKDSGKKYYKLRYLFSNGNEVVYVPVDSDVPVRMVMSKSEAENCLEVLKTIETDECEARQPALLTAHFQSLLCDGSMEGTLKVLKEIILREKKYEALGKKLRQAELHYLAIVEKAVSEEFAVSLCKDVEEIKGLLRSIICD